MAEAKRAGLKLATTGSNWIREGDTLYDPKQTPFLFHDGYAEYKKHGYWLSNRFMPGCTQMQLGNKIRVRGLIATYRYFKDKDKKFTFVTLGSAEGVYWDTVIQGKVKLHESDLLDVDGEIKSFFGSEYINVTKVNGLKALEREWRIPEEKVEPIMKVFLR